MLTKEEHIKYWVDTAKKDWQAIQKMYKSGVYLHALFFAHLHLEKLCKALWVKNNKENHPPKIHNLIRVLNEAKIQYSSEQLDFMNIMNQFQLEGRYPDYLNKLYKAYKRKNTGETLKQVNQFSKWLQQQL
jgi:HEPN domain-containing protein